MEDCFFGLKNNCAHRGSFWILKIKEIENRQKCPKIGLGNMPLLVRAVLYMNVRACKGKGWKFGWEKAHAEESN